MKVHRHCRKKIKNLRHVLYISYQYTVSENKLIRIGIVSQFVLKKFKITTTYFKSDVSLCSSWSGHKIIHAWSKLCNKTSFKNVKKNTTLNP